MFGVDSYDIQFTSFVMDVFLEDPLAISVHDLDRRALEPILTLTLVGG